MNHTPWLARQFNFDFPVTHFPFIAERLRGTAPRIEDMIKGLSSEELYKKPGGKWSIKEHIGHLTDLEELHEGRIGDFINGAKILRAADMNNKKTNEASHNNTPISELLANFRSVRKCFVKRLEDADEILLSRQALHPRLQKQMRLADMAFFVAEHDDHHLLLIRDLIGIGNQQ